jgi:hypothetical protein
MLSEGVGRRDSCVLAIDELAESVGGGFHRGAEVGRRSGAGERQTGGSGHLLVRQRRFGEEARIQEVADGLPRVFRISPRFICFFCIRIRALQARDEIVGSASWRAVRRGAR